MKLGFRLCNPQRLGALTLILHAASAVAQEAAPEPTPAAARPRPSLRRPMRPLPSSTNRHSLRLHLSSQRPPSRPLKSKPRKKSPLRST